MTARDDLRRMVHGATADMWTPPTAVDERTDQLYEAIHADALRDAASKLLEAAAQLHTEGDPKAAVYWSQAAAFMHQLIPDQVVRRMADEAQPGP